MPPRFITNPHAFSVWEKIKVSLCFPYFCLRRKWHRHRGMRVTVSSLQMHRWCWIFDLLLCACLPLLPRLLSASPPGLKPVHFLQLQVLNYTHLLLAPGDRKYASSFGSCSSQMLQLVSSDWLADKRGWLFPDRQVKRCKQTHFSPESAGPR